MTTYSGESVERATHDRYMARRARVERPSQLALDAAYYAERFGQFAIPVRELGDNHGYDGYPVSGDHLARAAQ